MLRMPLMASIITSIWRAAPKLSNFNASGHFSNYDAIPFMRQDVAKYVLLRTAWTDVTIQAFDARWLRASIEPVRRSRSLLSLYKRGFANSIYQSQYVFQNEVIYGTCRFHLIQIYRGLDVTLCTVSFVFWIIHWSANVKSSAVGTKLSS